MQRVAQDFDADRIFQTRIPMDINVAKAIDTFQPVVIDNPGSSGSRAFIKLSQELLTRVAKLTGC
jgi:cellulose biosynthesis protein BcsQ